MTGGRRSLLPTQQILYSHAAEESAAWALVLFSFLLWRTRLITIPRKQVRQLRNNYPTTLLQQSEAQSGACNARGVIYTAGVAAGLMLHQFCRWLRGQPIDCDLSLNLLASELTVA